ncbi:MarR family winged helix-turn-helix transcriptional regulator [Gordonia sp. OPL2]|uniref:MarR family winged helix-turn-helix transcriptional regulator n=1 Tax=Gordonia sp. OPL2 TaxID=2486274 RepID=UPI001CA3A638|nr:MarR family transcriptional regulator [Gordonia sp. OPL2]ROZ98331.1 MarR family transcriptional regulator [Gordonia sp. OPL2]
MTETPDPQTLLSDTALTVFRLNGQFLALAEELARPAGLTATRWQVLGAVLQRPLTVSDIARAMGITRQSVQRTADLLADDGLLEFRDNPHHRRAKLVVATESGIAAVRRINPAHQAAAQRIGDRMTPDAWSDALAALRALGAALEQTS